MYGVAALFIYDVSEYAWVLDGVVACDVYADVCYSKWCYGDAVSVDGDAGAAVVALPVACA